MCDGSSSVYHRQLPRIGAEMPGQGGDQARLVAAPAPVHEHDLVEERLEAGNETVRTLVHGPHHHGSAQSGA
ncbi:hypothetical protein OHA21_01120 [Actinoplanes sp. NBC_00393]|uniref:hypothetical protein n=1 Tax=Actinoplanes sp. NBC_00393 TaxID=2975953 RepID=UPI002E1ADF35